VHIQGRPPHVAPVVTAIESESQALVLRPGQTIHSIVMAGLDLAIHDSGIWVTGFRGYPPDEASRPSNLAIWALLRTIVSFVSSITFFDIAIVRAVSVQHLVEAST